MAKPHIKLKVKPEMGEIATIQRDVTRALTFGGVLENLDDTLRSRGRGKGLKIYDELERDCHAFAVLMKRRLAVTSRPWQVDAASESDLDKQAAELVERQFTNLGKANENEHGLITGFDYTTENLLDATLKGYAVSEVMWEARDNELVAARIIPRDQRRFVFDEDSKLRMLTREKLWDGIELPARKFIVHRFGAKDGSPYGLGLGHKLFWPVFFKKQDITFWLVFADKFGSPTAIGKYPPGSQKTEQDKLLQALKAIAQDAGIIVPEGMVVELLEAARAGSIDTYEKLARYMDEQISECVLGESLSTTPKPTGIGSGASDVQNEVRLEVAQADADLLSDTLNATLVRWIVDFNLPGAGYPTVKRVFEEEEDLELRSNVDQRLHEMGYEPAEVTYIDDTYGGKWKKKAAAPALDMGTRLARQQGRREPGAEFAEQSEIDDQQLLAQAAGELAGDWRRQLGPRVAELLAMAEESGDMVTFRERLAELAGADPAAPLVEGLERSAFTAQLLARTAGAGGTVDLAESRRAPSGASPTLTIAVDSKMHERLAEVIDRNTESNAQFAENVSRSMESLGTQNRDLVQSLMKAVAAAVARPQPQIKVVMPADFSEAVERQAESNERFVEAFGRQLAAWHERLIEAIGKLTRPRKRTIELPDGRVFKSIDEEVN